MDVLIYQRIKRNEAMGEAADVKGMFPPSLIRR
jgi:hypothetical protein